MEEYDQGKLNNRKYKKCSTIPLHTALQTAQTIRTETIKAIQPDRIKVSFLHNYFTISIFQKIGASFLTRNVELPFFDEGWSYMITESLSLLRHGRIGLLVASSALRRKIGDEHQNIVLECPYTKQTRSL